VQRRRHAIAHRWLRRRALLCIGVLASLAAAAAPPAQAATRTPTPAPSAGPEFGIRAALTGRTTLTHNHFAYALAAGGAASIADAVVVANYTAKPLTFSVHGADMVAATGGGFAPAAEGAPAQLVGGWIHMQQASVTVPAHREVQDPFTVTVPAGQPAGDFLGAVVVVQGSVNARGLQVLSRAALTVDVTVVEKAELKAAAGPLGAERQQDGVHFSVVVHNTGNVLFTFHGDVDVRDGGGHVLATVPLDPTGLYVIPGGDATVSGVWSGLPLWGSASAVATIEAKTSGGGSATVRTDTVQLGFFPWALLIALVAGVLAALLAVVLLRRRRRAG